MAKLSTELKEIDARIADTDWYTNASPDEVSESLKARGVLASNIEGKEMAWLELSERIEAVK